MAAFLSYPIQTNEITLAAAASGYAYQWIDCGNGNVPISGATGQTFTASANGSYAVQISDGTCTVVSDCMPISDLGLSDQIAGQVIVFPNPSGDGVFVVQFSGDPATVNLRVTNELDSWCVQSRFRSRADGC